jgi:hypothetical protein
LVSVLCNQDLQHLDHLRRVLPLRIEVRDLVGRKLKSGGADEAALAALPLGYCSDLIRWHEGNAPAPLDRAGTELIDREELFPRAEPRQDCCDLFEFGAVLGIWARKYFAGLLELVSEFIEVLGNRTPRHGFPVDASVCSRQRF